MNTNQKGSGFNDRSNSTNNLPSMDSPSCMFNQTSNMSQGLNPSTGNIKVVCRFRPLNEKEKNLSQNLCVDFIDSQTCSIKSNGENNNIHKFNFDMIFDCNCTQQELYEYSAKPIVDGIIVYNKGVLEGFNGTIFAYGQTSSGKTYTMSGVMDNLEKQGIIPRMIHQVFDHISNSPSEIEFIVKVSIVEIYMEKIKDLIDISRTNLNVREDKTGGLYIEDLTEHYVISEDEVLDLMKIGNDNRSVSATNMNEHSSRSHSIVIIAIHQNNTKDLTAKTGKLYLVDLAGSEKISKTGATGMTLEEAKTINKSLTTLGMVINSLTDGKSTHIPYRDSKLTRVLQESLGGNAKTTLIITASPSSYNDAETLSTLRFGLRAKKIKNKPKINKELTVAELKIIIEKLEGIISQSKKRVDQLERFITRNGLKIPLEDEDDLEFPEIKFDQLDENFNLLDNKDEIFKEIEREKNTKEIKVLTLEIENLIDIYIETGVSIPYKDLMERYEKIDKKLKALEEEKANMSNRLFEAIEKIAIFRSSSDNEKANYDEQINQIKFAYEESIRFLKEKINELEMSIETRNKISLTFVKSDIISLSMLAFIKKRSFEKIEVCSNKIIEFISDKKLLVSTNIQTDNQSEKPEVDEGFLNEKKKFENEKKYILKVLEENTDKISQLENENNDLKEKIKMLEPKLNQEDKSMLKKIQFLEKSIEQINIMYHKMVTQKSELKIANQFLEKKMKKKHEKLEIIEKEFNEAKEQIKSLNDRISQLQKQNLSKAYATNNVVKVIKGGNRSNLIKQGSPKNPNSEQAIFIVDSQEN